MISYRSYCTHKVTVSAAQREKGRLKVDYKETPSLKLVTTKVADEVLTEVQREIFTSGRGGPCFTPLRWRETRRARRRGTVVRRRSRRSHRDEIPPWSQSYLRMLRTGGEERRRGCSSIFWGHIKVCWMGSHWPGVPQEVVTTFFFLLPTLKRMQKPMGLMWNPSPLLLLFTVPPNDTYACM